MTILGLFIKSSFIFVNYFNSFSKVKRLKKIMVYFQNFNFIAVGSG